MRAPLIPDDRFPSVDEVDVTVERVGATLVRLCYIVTGRIDQIVLPPPAPPLRTERLWETTCFEAFLAPANGLGYREFNFSPSGRWAAYQFTAYRAGMSQAHLPAAPEIQVSQDSDRLTVCVTFSPDLRSEPYKLGLSAVIEVLDEDWGYKSHWALAHPPGPPDFHHEACFALELPAANAP